LRESKIHIQLPLFGCETGPYFSESASTRTIPTTSFG
jgi:hypothetical protein